MNKEQYFWIQNKLNGMDNKLFTLEKKLDKLIPEVRNVSKHLAEAKKLANKGKPPRKQPKKKYTGLSREKNTLGNKRTIPAMQDGCGRILNFS